MADGEQHSNGETTVETEYTIEKFASFLVMKYSKLNCVDPEFDKAYGAFTNLKISRDIFKCIDLLLKHYSEIVDEISIEIFVYMNYLALKKEYMVQLLSRCLKLSKDNPEFFEFLLVCVYIGKISECLYEKYGCCKVLKLTADCLEAVYSRRYLIYFHHNDGFKGLANYCTKLNREEPMYGVSIENEEGQTVFPSLSPKQNEKVKILKNLNDTVEDIIELKEEEKRLAMLDKPYFKPITEKEDFLIHTVVRRETARDDALETFNEIDEKTNKTGLRCAQCESKCAQYPKDLINELKSKETIRVGSGDWAEVALSANQNVPIILRMFSMNSKVRK